MEAVSLPSVASTSAVAACSASGGTPAASATAACTSGRGRAGRGQRHEQTAAAQHPPLQAPCTPRLLPRGRLRSPAWAAPRPAGPPGAPPAARTRPGRRGAGRRAAPWAQTWLGQAARPHRRRCRLGGMGSRDEKGWATGAGGSGAAVRTKDPLARWSRPAAEGGLRRQCAQARRAPGRRSAAPTRSASSMSSGRCCAYAWLSTWVQQGGRWQHSAATSQWLIK